MRSQPPLTAIALDSLPEGSSLRLLALPSLFTQDKLLTTDEFIREAKRHGVSIVLQDLERYHRSGLLAPLFLFVDEVDDSLRLDCSKTYALNPRGWAIDSAAEGRLRDPSAPDTPDRYPYIRPSNAPPRWVNGYLYSSWQLLDLPRVQLEAQASFADAEQQRRANDRRGLTRVLAALATRHLPNIVGQISYPGGTDQKELNKSRYDVDEGMRLYAASFAADRLQPAAEDLLLDAHHRDPMAGWWPLIRRAGHQGWKKIEGVPLACLWQRIAAETLLRAHEQLADSGVLAALPDVSGLMCFTALDDRVTPPESRSRPIDLDLAEYGLSPHPRVLALVEGKTEAIHLPRLLAEFGLDRGDRVRVMSIGGTKANPHLIASYVATPRIAPLRGALNAVGATATAVVVAMDPENKWSSPESCEQFRRAVQTAVRENVEEQGGRVTDDELDFLVEVSTWGQDSYELANFSDDELMAAIDKLALSRRLDRQRAPDWHMAVGDELRLARREHWDIGVVLGRLRLPDAKIELAELLWPALSSRLERHIGEEIAAAPVIELVFKIVDKHNNLALGHIALTDQGN